EHPQEGLNLASVTGDLDDERIGHNINDARPEEIHRLEHVRTRLMIDAHLDKHVLALHGLRFFKFDDLDDVNELIELLRHLLDLHIIFVDDDRNARQTLKFGRAHRKRLDVEATACEEPGNTG